MTGEAPCCDAADRLAAATDRITELERALRRIGHTEVFAAGAYARTILHETGDQQ